MPNMKDVAKKAGVSLATVSNYINKTKTVSDERGDRIADAIEQLQYVPNQIARVLKSKRNKSIGVILPNIQDNYYAQIFQEIERLSREKSYGIMLGITHDLAELEQNQFNNFLQLKVAGFFFVTAQPFNTSFFKNNLIDNGIPFIHIDRKISLPNLNYFGFDNQKTLYIITDLLIKDGKKEITLITGPEIFSCEEDAVRGYRQAHEDNSVMVNNGRIIQTPLNKEAAFRICILHFKGMPPEVIISTSELVTIGINEALSVLGYEDFKVITLGYNKWNQFNNNKFISTTRKSFLLGNEASKALFSQIEEPEGFEAKSFVFEDELSLNKIPRYIKKNLGHAIRVMMLDTLQVELLQGIISNFSNSTGIDIQIQAVKHQHLLDQIYQKQHEFDIIMYDIPWLYPLAKEGILADITDKIEDADFNQSVYLNNCLNFFGRYENRYYGLPFMCAPQIMYYRKDLFEDRAIVQDVKKLFNIRLRPPRTWAEFNKIAGYFTRSQNENSPTLYGTAVPAAYKECLMPEFYLRLRAYGGEIFDHNMKVVFNSPKTVKAYTDLIHLLSKSAPDNLQYNDMTVVDEFLKGNIAMLVTYPPFISNISDLQKNCLTGRVGYAHVPMKCPILGGWGLGIIKESQNNEDAFRFINWACGEEMANYFTILFGQSVIEKTFQNSELISLYPWLPFYKSVYANSKPLTIPFKPDKEIISYKETDEIISKGLYNIIQNHASIKNTIDETHCQLVGLFNKYGYPQ